jgi:hypothetical protein
MTGIAMTQEGRRRRSTDFRQAVLVQIVANAPHGADRHDTINRAAEERLKNLPSSIPNLLQL